MIMFFNNWDPQKARNWLERYADDVAGDAYHKMNGDPMLYSAAGAAYYAVKHETGYATQDQFEELFINHLGLDHDYLSEVLDEFVNAVSPAISPVPAIPAEAPCPSCGRMNDIGVKKCWYEEVL